uniref:HNH endonuclease n=1 Tax=Pseudomonas phage HRDY3 TaxID=3236930 RepID=A0AB39CET7_9VIRU
MSDVKFKDLRQGITIYTVNGYDPLCKSTDGHQWHFGVKRHFVTGKPYMHPTVKAWAVPTRCLDWAGNWSEDKIFLNTYNVRHKELRKWPATNHACFHTARAAERYGKRFAAGCMTAREWEHAHHWKESREEMRRQWAENDRYLYEAELESQEFEEHDDGPSNRF